MKKYITCCFLIMFLSFSSLIKLSFSETNILDTIKITHSVISSEISANSITKAINIKVENISGKPISNLKLLLTYVSGLSDENNIAFDFGNLVSGGTIASNEPFYLNIDRSQLTNAITIYTWQIEYDNYEQEHILDEYLIEE